jgi:malonyl-CoA/methylmalonyl-CoA synthetase
VNSLLCPLTAGASVEFSDPFSADNVWNRWMQRDATRLTLNMAVPTIYSKLISSYHNMSVTEQKKARESCKQFRVMISGSSALPTTVFNEWKNISGHELLERYFNFKISIFQNI